MSSINNHTPVEHFETPTMQDNALRWRANRQPSFTGTPRDRGFVEDYGEDDGSVRSATQRLQTLWACRHNCTINVFVFVTIVICSLTAQLTGDNRIAASAALTVVCCLLLLYQRRSLRRLVSVRHQHNEIRRRLHYFRQEKERLHRTMDRLDETAADLHDIPKQLHEVSKNKSVDRLVELIQQQKSTQEQIRQRLNQQVIHQIMSIVVQADRDSNWSLRPTEVERLVLRLARVEAMEFNEKRFREMIGPQPDLGSVMKVIRSLLERDDEYQHADPVFRMKTSSASSGPYGEGVFDV
eukprot:scaffold1869_cov122-Cylindrotheca_fusiformis.AAC.20